MQSLDGSVSHSDGFDNHSGGSARHLDSFDNHLDCFASHLDGFPHSSIDIYCLRDRFDYKLQINSSEQAPASIPSSQGTCHKHTGKTRNPNLRQEPCQPSHATAPINGSTSIERFTQFDYICLTIKKNK